MNTYLIVLGINILLHIGVIGLTWAEETALAHPVQLESVLQKDMQAKVHAYGQVSFDEAWVQQINLAYSGQIVSLPVLTGEWVQKGQVLAEIAVDPMAASSYQQATHAVRFAKEALRRVQDLLKNQLATQAQLAVVEKNLATSQTQLAQLRSRRLGQSLHVIYAPFDAVVAGVMVQDKQRVLKGTALMQLGNAKHLKVLLGVDSADIQRVHVGDSVQLANSLYPKLQADAVVDKVLHLLNPQTRLVDVLVRLSGKNTGGFLVGMPIRAAISVQSFQQAYVVPRHSLMLDQNDNTYLMKVKQQHVVKIRVKRLMTQAGDVVIQGDVQAGDVIVGLGVAELLDGDLIREEDTP